MTTVRVLVKSISIPDEEIFSKTIIGFTVYTFSKNKTNHPISSNSHPSKLYDVPVSFVTPSSFEAVYCSMCGRRRVVVARYRMICDPWPTVTSQPIRLSTNFMTLIASLTFTDYEWFPWSICNGCGMPAGNAYPSGHLVPSPTLGLASAPIVETKFLELAMSLLDFWPRIPLGVFSILLVLF